MSPIHFFAFCHCSVTSADSTLFLLSSCSAHNTNNSAMARRVNNKRGKEEKPSAGKRTPRARVDRALFESDKLPSEEEGEQDSSVEEDVVDLTTSKVEDTPPVVSQNTPSPKSHDTASAVSQNTQSVSNSM